jgi:hypothetical protein
MIKRSRPSMIRRMIRAAALDVSLYEEVEADRSSLPQALMIVVLTALATSIGLLGNGIGATFSGVLFGIIGWVMWAGVTYFVGTRILGTPQTHADWGQLARTLGFAQSIGVLRIFGLIPVLGAFIIAIAVILQLVAMVIAVKTALDYTSVGRAIGVVLIGAIPYVIIGILTQ